MTLDPAIAVAERSDAARHLIGRAQREIVDLVTLSALELCVLGGPQQPLFDERVARAWGKLGNRQRRKAMDDATAGLVERGLLLGDGALKPDLGLVLAARCRPSAIVVTDAGEADLRTPQFFALGDQAEPVRAVVGEEPTSLPDEFAARFPHVRKLGPLAWIYRYTLFSQVKAAEILAALTISPPQRDGVTVAPAWIVTAHYPGTGKLDGERITVQGDGIVAQLAGPGGGTGAAYEEAGLRSAMFQLMNGWGR